MFVLACLRDTVIIEAKNLGQQLTKNIYDALNKKYANKVVHEVGLCITVWDLTKVGDSILYQGDSSAHTQVEFRMVVFRPFVDEILNGKVKKSSKEGVHVTMDFFEDIFIPADLLPQPSKFLEHTLNWMWEYDSEDGRKSQYTIDKDHKLRFKVTEEIFVEKMPTSCDPPQSNQQAEPFSVKDNDDNTPPYTVIGSIEQPGLGPLCWWKESS